MRKARRCVGLEVQVPEEQVLVQVAAHQPLLVRVAVEKRLPRLYLLRHVRGQRLRAFVRRTGREPARDRRELALVETGQAVGHAGQRIFLREGIELVDARAVEARSSEKSNASGSTASPGSGWARFRARLRYSTLAARLACGVCALVQYREKPAAATAKAVAHRRTSASAAPR